MLLTSGEAYKLLSGLGLQLSECGSHLRGYVIHEGRRILAVHCVVSPGSLPGHVPSLFRKSLKLTEDEFEALRSSQMSREDYLKLLASKGLL